MTKKNLSHKYVERSLSFVIDELTQQGLTCQFMAGDCSYRKYYRLHNESEDTSAVLMYAPPPEKMDEFCYLSEKFAQIGISTPEIYTVYPDDHCMIIEDFGDLTYTRIFDQVSPDIWFVYYQAAIDVLIEITKHCADHCEWGVPTYTNDKFRLDLENFVTWAWPYYMNIPPEASIIEEYNAIWNDVLLEQANIPKTLVHMDYHIGNIMYLPCREGYKKCGIIDFQDATWGDVTYDIMSLIEDERIVLPPSLVKDLKDYYKQKFPFSINWSSFDKNWNIQSAIRHAKNIGRFTRQSIKNNNHSYLSYLPHMWHMLNESLTKEPCLKHVHDWFSKYFKDMINPYS